MEFMFAPTEAVWLLALIYQPVVLVYFVINDKARKPFMEIEGVRERRVSKVLHSITSIFSLSLSCFTIVVLVKILLMNVYGVEALIYMLGGLLLMLLVTIAYLASFFKALNTKQLVYFAGFIVGAIVTYAILIPSGYTLEGLYGGEFYQLFVPFLFPGLVGFISFAMFVFVVYLINKMGKAEKIIPKLSQPLWNKRKTVKKIFGFYFHLIIWLLLVLETLLNQSGYSILSWI